MINRKLSKVALAAMALALTGCPANTTTPPIPSPSASAAVSPAPGVTPPAATPAPGTPTATPTAGTPTATPDAGAPIKAKPVVVSGIVYDEQGATVEGASVTIRSLNAAASYEATATTSAGSWVVNNVPEGVNVEIVVTKAGWTTRKRVGAFQADSREKNTMHFGAPASQAKEAGAAYFISDRPEIESTVPVHKAEQQDAGMLVYKMKLSEALSEDGRERFEDAVRVFPANAAASPNAAAVDQETAADTGALNIDAAYDYVIKKGTTFLGDSSTAAKVTWNEAGTEATFTFNAPLISNSDTAAKYQVGLVAGGSGSPEIEDLQGKQLGTSDTGALSAYPAAGNLIRNAFREIDLALEGTPASDADRWNATHDSVATFKVKTDEVEPKLEAVDVSTVGDDTRIELTFNEPMAAYDDQDGYFHAELLDLSNYSFAIGEKESDLTLELEGDSGAPNVDPTAEAIYGDQADDDEEEFRLVDSDGDAADIDDDGDVSIEVDPRNAKKVWITIHGIEDWLDADMGAIKARVEGVGDPAGNTISDSAADKGNVIGDL